MMNRIRRELSAGMALCFVMGLCIPVYAQETILRVDGDSGSPNPPGLGSDWGPNDAYKFLRDALAVAELNATQLNPYHIWVAETVPTNPYRPDQEAANQAGSEDPTATFSLPIFVHIYGGFLGIDHPTFPGVGETFLSQRDPENNETVLSGDYTIGIPIGPPCDDPDAGDCFVENLGTQGCNDLCSGAPCAGCCNIVCSFDPFCCDSQFGEWEQSCADLAVSLCTIGATAAFHVVTAANVDESARVDGFTITGGSAVGQFDPDNRGGGMLILNNANPLVVRCIFEGNSAVDGGALSVDLTSNARVVNCAFKTNSATSRGGAVFTEGPPLFTNCVFSANSAANGGGMYNIGALADPRLGTCTFSGNTAVGNGGGIFNAQTVTVTNCVLWDNQDSSGMIESSQIFLSAGSAVVNYSCIEGLTGGLGGTGNIGDDPQFLDDIGPDGVPRTGDEDLRLNLLSLCNDAGNNPAVPGDIVDLDLDGDLLERTPLDRAMVRRFALAKFNAPDICKTGTVDMGAYENADCNANGLRDEDLMESDTNEDGIPDECQDCNENDILDPVDIADGTSQDCNNNGVPDECDILGGCSTDKAGNGVPDECECIPERVDIVFIVDTSGSVQPNFGDICAMAEQVITNLAAFPHCITDIRSEYLGITATPFGFDCPALAVSTVVDLLGTNAVPGNPGKCGSILNDFESWGPATAMIADLYDWRDLTTRVIVPISDEGPCLGNPPCTTGPNTADGQSIENAIALANLNNVFVFPVTDTIEHADAECVRFLADRLGDLTSGEAFHRDFVSGYPEIRDLLVGAISNLAAACVPDCPCPGDVDGDCDVDVPDLLALLAVWNMPCPDCCNCNTDLDGDCVMSAVPDLLTLLADWGCGTHHLDSELAEALAEIGFADLAAYLLWLSGATDDEALISAQLLAEELD